VSGVAHELNNPLQAILARRSSSAASRPLGPEALEELGVRQDAGRRAREIIRNLLGASAASSPARRRLVDLRDVINEVVQLRRRDLDNPSIVLDIEISTLARCTRTSPRSSRSR